MQNQGLVFQNRTYLILYLTYSEGQQLGVLNLKSRNSKSYMVPMAPITLSFGTYAVFCITVYAKKFMPWSVCKTLPTYVSHSCYNSEVLGFCAFKLTNHNNTPKSFLALKFNSRFFLQYINKTFISISHWNKLPFPVCSEETMAGHFLLLLRNTGFSYLTFSTVCVVVVVFCLFLFSSAYHSLLPWWNIICTVCMKFPN